MAVNEISTVAGIIAVGFLGSLTSSLNEWILDRMEDRNRKLSPEERVRLLRIRKWRQQAGEHDFVRFKEVVGADARAIIANKLDITFEKALLHHPNAEKTIYPRELGWIKDVNDPLETRWMLQPIAFNTSPDQYGDKIILSRKLAHKLGYCDAKGNNVYPDHRPEEPTNSSHRKIANLVVVIAGVEVTRQGFVKDLSSFDPECIVVPDTVITELKEDHRLKYVDKF